MPSVSHPRIAIMLIASFFSTASAAHAADPRARCDAATLRAGSAGVAALLRCEAQGGSGRQPSVSCKTKAAAAFNTSMAKARRSSCTATATPDALWATVQTVTADLGVALRASTPGPDACVSKQLIVAADSVRLRMAVDEKARKGASPAAFAKGLGAAENSISRWHAAATKPSGCSQSSDFVEFVHAIDITTVSLLSATYACQDTAPEDVARLATGKWKALLDHAGAEGFALGGSAILCPPAEVLDADQEPLIALVDLRSADNTKTAAIAYPGAGITTLWRRDSGGAVSLFHWLGGFRLSSDGHFSQVNEAGAPPTQAVRNEESESGGLFGPCKAAHDAGVQCWTDYCSQNFQHIAFCGAVLQCLTEPFSLLGALGCAASGQAVINAPCPKPGEFLPCTIPGKDSACPVSGQCNFLDVCHADDTPDSDSDVCAPDTQTGGPQQPYCVDDMVLQQGKCDQGRCIPNHPIRCKSGCCGPDGHAHCWDKPGSCAPQCGNGLREGNEECDDGNDTDPNDGCDKCACTPGESTPQDCQNPRVFWFVGGCGTLSGCYGDAHLYAGDDERTSVSKNLGTWGAPPSASDKVLEERIPLRPPGCTEPNLGIVVSSEAELSGSSGPTSGHIHCHIRHTESRRSCDANLSLLGARTGFAICPLLLGHPGDSYAITVSAPWTITGTATPAQPFVAGGSVPGNGYSFSPPVNKAGDLGTGLSGTYAYAGAGFPCGTGAAAGLNCYQPFCLSVDSVIGPGNSQYSNGAIEETVDIGVTILPKP